MSTRLVGVIISKLPEKYYPVLQQYGLKDMDPSFFSLLSYDTHEHLSLEGFSIEYFQFIVAGKVKISISTATGKNLLYGFYEGSGTVGCVELMRDIPAVASAQALGPVQCVALPKKQYASVLKNNLAFMQTLCCTLSDLFVESEKNLSTNILYPLETRLCSYILMTHDGGRFKEKLVTLSALLGANYRHLQRVLERLCSKGILRKEKGGYIIVDIDGLEQLAAFY